MPDSFPADFPAALQRLETRIQALDDRLSDFIASAWGDNANTRDDLLTLREEIASLRERLSLAEAKLSQPSSPALSGPTLSDHRKTRP